MEILISQQTQLNLSKSQTYPRSQKLFFLVLVLVSAFSLFKVGSSPINTGHKQASPPATIPSFIPNHSKEDYYMYFRDFAESYSRASVNCINCMVHDHMNGALEEEAEESCYCNFSCFKKDGVYPIASYDYTCSWSF